MSKTIEQAIREAHYSKPANQRFSTDPTALKLFLETATALIQGRLEQRPNKTVCFGERKIREIFKSMETRSVAVLYPTQEDIELYANALCNHIGQYGISATVVSAHTNRSAHRATGRHQRPHKEFVEYQFSHSK